MARLTQVAHVRLAQVIQPGDLAIDATAGNGHDTLCLAKLVGPQGRVLAIDRQPAALVSTRERLAQNDAETQVTLIEGDHARLLQLAPSGWTGRVAAVVFNLGYLPGSDKEVITTAESTLNALDASAQLLKSGGLLSVLIYRGHDGGHAEEAMIEDWLRTNARLFSGIDWNDGDFPTATSPRLLNCHKQ